MFANAPISTFQPLIIKDLGYTGLKSLLLTMPSGAYAGTMMLITTYLAYKFPGWRSYIIALCQVMTIFASLLLWLLPRSATGGLLFAVYVLPTTGSAYAVAMGLFLANNAGYTKRSLTSSMMYVGYSLGMVCPSINSHSLNHIFINANVDVGNFAGPQVFRAQDAPRYTLGFIVVVITAIIAGLIVLVYRFVCAYENRRRDALGTTEAFEHAYEDDLTDKKVRETYRSDQNMLLIILCRIYNSDMFCDCFGRFLTV